MGGFSPEGGADAAGEDGRRKDRGNFGGLTDRLVTPRHIVMALATGLVCGALASRTNLLVSPPYAATIGSLILYPLLVTTWQRIARFGWVR